MKKVFYLLVALVVIIGVSGCEKVEKGNYKEGTYKGEAIDTYNNGNNLATATIEVDKDGKISSVYLDTEYDGSTKKKLGSDYNMKKFNPGAAGEWYEQVEKLEAAIIEHQGIDFLNLDTDGYTEAVSGCTIKVDALIKAVSNALEQAK
ncbi:MAG: FMN-binding protein [Bacilli bacterium]|nr:FMN-binding protein [Bacilli bacterium]